MPPSVVLIIYGLLTEQSIGTLFLAGIFPAVFITILFVLAIHIYCRIWPDRVVPGKKFRFKEMFFALGELWETMTVFAVVMGGLFVGLFTPTKSGAIGSLSILLIVLARRRITYGQLLQAIYGTLKISCMVLMLIAGATIFGHFLALTRIPLEVAHLVEGLACPSWVIMGIICLIYLLGGCFIDSMALMMLTLPIFFPVVVHLGYDPIWFGIIIVLVTHMGIITPPVGISVYIVRGIAGDVPLMTIFRGCVPFLLALILGTAIFIAFPDLLLFFVPN